MNWVDEIKRMLPPVSRVPVPISLDSETSFNDKRNQRGISLDFFD
jgi:hypothetical protein